LRGIVGGLPGRWAAVLSGIGLGCALVCAWALATKIFPLLPVAPVVEQRAVASANRLGVRRLDYQGESLLVLERGDGLEVVGHGVRDFFFAEALPRFHGWLLKWVVHAEDC
jgi:hypothetical protein